MLQRARLGHYPIERARHIPPDYLKRYCLKGNGEQQGTLLIDGRLRRRVEFAQINLNGPLPQIGPFDLIFLRNVMIYFNAQTKRQVVARVLATLRPGGYLCIGHSESLNDISSAVRQIAPADLPQTMRRAPMNPIKVMVIDDSAVVRQAIASLLDAAPGLRVIATVADPLLAIERMRHQWPDVIVLDVEMPRMDGLTFLTRIMQERPTPVVMCSRLTERGARVTLDALAAGAVAIVTKPPARREALPAGCLRTTWSRSSGPRRMPA